MCTTCITNYRCIDMHHIHIHAPPNTNVCIDAPYTHTCTHVHHMHHQLQVHIYASFTHTCTTKHICVHRCTIYTYVQHMNTCSPHASLNTYVHHQTPPKIKIYLVSIPSALYERPCQNDRYVLNSAVLLLFRCFSYESTLFMKAQVLFTKSAGAFHKKHMLFMCFSKDHLHRNCNPMFVIVCKRCCVNFTILHLQLHMCTTYTCLHAQHAPYIHNIHIHTQPSIHVQ